MSRSFDRARVRLTMLIASGGVMLASESVFSQTPTASSDAPSSNAGLEEVVVTGSYIHQNPEETASPIVTIDQNTLQQLGISNVSQLTNTLTANYGSVGGVVDLTKGGGQDDRNTRSANLRGLGPSSTLVLLNGRRLASQEADANGNNYVNLATLVPLIEISRVDTVLDGASALYGSDAIAGVMNFVTDKHFQGFRSTAKYTAIQDAPGWDVEAEVGAGGDRFHLVASVDYQTQAHLQEGDRSYLSFNNLSGGSQPGNFILKSAPVAPGGGDAPFGIPVTIGNFRALGSNGLPAAGEAGFYNIEHAHVYGAHVVAGSEGEIAKNWTYDADLVYSRDISEDEPNDTYIASFQNALNGFGGANCTITATGPLAGEKPGVAPCFYFNPFGNGEPTPTAWISPSNIPMSGPGASSPSTSPRRAC